MGTKENRFQSRLKLEIARLFPGCEIIKNEPWGNQGIPDLLILFGDRWAMLECKKSADEVPGPNQRYRVGKFSRMSFAAFIYPENKDQVLDDLQQAFGARR